jgi:hypothetical protein
LDRVGANIAFVLVRLDLLVKRARAPRPLGLDAALALELRHFGLEPPYLIFQPVCFRLGVLGLVVDLLFKH